jgi:hypothetical protein
MLSSIKQIRSGERQVDINEKTLRKLEKIILCAKIET